MNTQNGRSQVTVRHLPDHGWTVELDGLPVTGDAAKGLTAIEAEELSAIVERAVAGDQDALDQLDRRGIEPPVLEPDDTPMPTCEHVWSGVREHPQFGLWRSCVLCRDIETVPDYHEAVVA